MGGLVTSVKLNFVDGFSAGFAGAKAKLAGLGDVSEGLVKKGKKIAMTGAVITAGLTMPLAAATTAAFNAGEAIDRKMANVQSLGLTLERVQELKTGLQESAIATRTSTGIMADGLYNVVSAFGDSKDTLKILELNAKAAKAGVASVSDAINLTSAITKGYGDTSITAIEKASDLSLMVVKLGQTDFPQLAASMGRAIPLAVSLGVTQEGLGGSLATLTGVTGTAAEVSTQLRGTMQALSAPSAEMTKLIKAQGFASGQAMIESLGLQGSFLAIAEASQRTGQPLQKYMGSIEGQTAAMTLTGAQMDTFKAKMAEMADVTGTTEAAFKAQTEGINKTGSELDLMKVQLEVASQRLAVGLAPAVTSVLTAATPLIEKIGDLATRFSEMDAGQQKTIVGALAIVAAIGPVTTGIGGITAGVGGLVKGFQVVAPIFGGFNAALRGTELVSGKTTTGLLGLAQKGAIKVGSGMRKAGKAVFSFGKQAILGIPKLFGLAAANWAVVGPVLAIVAAVGAAVAVGVLLYKNWDTIQVKAGEIWTGITGAFNAGIDWIQVKIDGFVAYIKKPIDTVASFGEKVASLFGGKKEIKASVSTDTEIPKAPEAGPSLPNNQESNIIPFAPYANKNQVSADTSQPAIPVANTQNEINASGVNNTKPRKSEASILPFDTKAAVSDTKIETGAGLIEENNIIAFSAGQKLPETFAAGIKSNFAPTESAALAMTQNVDAYFPHSDAKKGPLSGLTASGASLVSTFQKGAEENSSELDLNRILTPPEGTFKPDLKTSLNLEEKDESTGQVYHIHIENLYVNAEEIETAMGFIEMLKAAGGFS